MTTAVRLRARAPFAGRALLEFLAHRTVAGVDAVDGNVYRRAGVALAIRDTGATVTVDGGGDIDDAARRARRMLDLDADTEAIARTLGRDRALAPLVRASPGLRVAGAWDGFEIAVRAVVGQQVTVAAARTLLARIVARCAAVAPAGPSGFPSAAAVLVADLDGIGMPGARVRTVRAIAAAVDAGAVDLDGATPAGDVRVALLAVPGVGPWTANYVAMRLGDGDAFPTGDVGLRNAAAALGLPTAPRELAARAERWRPWRAYATVHLWRTLG